MPGFILQNSTGLCSDKPTGKQGLPVSQTKYTTGTQQPHTQAQKQSIPLQNGGYKLILSS